MTELTFNSKNHIARHFLCISLYNPKNTEALKLSLKGEPRSTHIERQSEGDRVGWVR